MNAKNCKEKVTTVATGLIIGGVAMTTLTTTGCEKRAAEQAAAWTAGSAEAVADAVGRAEKPELRSKLAGNHNETFLVNATDSR